MSTVAAIKGIRRVGVGDVGVEVSVLAVAEVALMVFAVVLAVAVALLKLVCRYDRCRIAASSGISAVATVVGGRVMAVDGRGVGEGFYWVANWVCGV